MHCGKIRYKVDAQKQAAERPFEHYIIPRFTRFQKPAHHQGEWTIQSIYAALAENDVRNELIAQDVLTAVEQGRNPIVLTERKKHVNQLYKLLANKKENVFCLVGGVSQKHNRELMEKIRAIPADEPLIIVATGKYVGEGFDLPRLDTLFLAMPISWKGTVQQYAGRLHRIVESKDEVQVYDYVDVYEPMLETMYQRRLKGYAAIGYKAKGATEPIEEIHAIFDSLNFAPVYSTDIIAAQREVVVVSPFLGHRRVEASIAQFAAAKAKVTVITRPPESYPNKDMARITACIATLTNSGVIVKTKENIHQKFAVIDQRLVWYGSINLLSYGSAEESIMRIESLSIAGELLRGLGL
jgi:superfamily II DNA or RNA helicase